MTLGKEKKYFCPYCGNTFIGKAKVVKKQSNKVISNQKKCLFCGNNIKTWDDKSERDYIILAKKELK